MSRRDNLAPQNIRDIQSACLVRSTFGLDCKQCMYYNMECERAKVNHGVTRPADINVTNYYSTYGGK